MYIFPQVRRVKEDENTPRLIKKLLLIKYDLNYLRPDPRKFFSKREIRIPWSTVSNAAPRSKITRKAESTVWCCDVLENLAKIFDRQHSQLGNSAAEEKQLSPELLL